MAELTRADLRSLVERNLDAWQRHDVAALVASHAPDAIVESPMFGTRRGRTELEESYRAFFKSFPDVTLSNDAILVDPPHVAMFTQFGGTHMDEFFGLPGTNKHVDMRVGREIADQVDAEPAVGGLSRRFNQGFQTLGRHQRPAEHAEAAGVGDRGRQFRSRDKSHAGIEDGCGEPELLGDPCLEHC